MKTVVTMGVCVKNSEASVKEAVDSIIGQDFPHELMEIIVVDGCSEDKTLAIIEECLSGTDIGSRVFHENEGLGAARQIVVDNAGGDYIVWVDGDMALTSSYVREQVDFMEKNPHVGMARGIEEYEGSNLVAVLESMRPLVYRSRNWKGFAAMTGGAIYRMKAIKQAGGFDRRIRGALEDADLAMRVQSLGWTATFSNPVFYHTPRQTWQALWREYFWWGYGSHFIRHKHGKSSMTPLFEFPPFLFLSGAARSVYAYKLTHKLVSVLLPVQYFFKQVAWCVGYLHGHFDKYGHGLA
jgi:glycosyltransferase involved in cell wall biosynthesis